MTATRVSAKGSVFVRCRARPSTLGKLGVTLFVDSATTSGYLFLGWSEVIHNFVSSAANPSSSGRHPGWLHPGISV